MHVIAMVSAGLFPLCLGRDKPIAIWMASWLGATAGSSFLMARLVKAAYRGRALV
jgi:hypothetical protein